jgi:tetratricopeptide (TPR) repeat protein
MIGDVMLTDLAATPIAETLRRLSEDRKSGDLQVRSGKTVKTVFFDHGRIVFAASNLKKDRLGEALVALGRITDEEFTRASALMEAVGKHRRRFGDALVRAGVMDKNEVGTSVARQVKTIVMSLFTLTEGAAFFDERRCSIPLEYMVSLSVPHLLYDGVRTMKSQDLVEAGLGDMDRRASLIAVPPFNFHVKECPKEEVEILELAQRRVTLRRLAWVTGGVDFERLRAVYALLSSGVLSTADGAREEDAPSPIIQLETGTFLLSALRHSPDPEAREAILQEVEDELERSAHLDREMWLKVSRTAPKEEFVKALEDKMERYHALLEAVGDDEKLKTNIEVILGRASAMLRLARLTAEKPAAQVQAQGPAAEPVPAVAPPQPAETLTAAPPSGPPQATPPPITAPPITAPPMMPPPMTAPPAVSPPPAAAAAPAPSPGSGFQASAQLEHLLLEADVRMTVSDYANAIKLYARIVDLAPQVAHYHVRLAIAMASYPATAKKAEREFLAALRLEPDNPDIHYQFGLYYKVMRQRARALAEMQTAVRLNPRHRPAREELEALSPRDSALKSLKKLFR